MGFFLKTTPRLELVIVHLDMTHGFYSKRQKDFDFQAQTTNTLHTTDFCDPRKMKFLTGF
jgi:hypothetical protein